MGSIMDQERPWKKPGYKEPSYQSIEEQMKSLRNWILTSSKDPNKWSLFRDQEKK